MAEQRAAQSGDEPADDEALELAQHRRNGERPSGVLVVPHRSKASAETACPDIARQPQRDEEDSQREEVVPLAGVEGDAEELGCRRVDPPAEHPRLPEQPTLRGQREPQRGDREHEPSDAQRRQPDDERHDCGRQPGGEEPGDDVVGVRGDDERQLARETGDDADREPDDAERHDEGQDRGRLVRHERRQDERNEECCRQQDAPGVPDEEHALIGLGERSPRLHRCPVALVLRASPSRSLQQERDEDGDEQHRLHGAAARMVRQQHLLDDAEGDAGAERDRQVRHARDDRRDEGPQQQTGAEELRVGEAPCREDEDGGVGRHRAGHRPRERRHPVGQDPRHARRVGIGGDSAHGQSHPTALEEQRECGHHERREHEDGEM